MMAHGSETKSTPVVVDQAHDAFSAGEELANLWDSEPLLPQKMSAQVGHTITASHLESLPHIGP